MHIVLLGDSVFDNRAYVGREPDVVTHLRALLPREGRATLLAIDGSTTGDLGSQLASIPDDASLLVVSIGGNDALLNADLLDLPVRSTAEALTLMAERSARFERDYRAAIRAVAKTGRPFVLCTIYNGNFPAEQRTITRVALMIFNDVILRVALEYRVPVIELRAVCAAPEDYANPIEPSGSGGKKIAQAILREISAYK